ncbi:MAG: YdeI/OmpD-associated family protein [Propionibacteriales bacterium]|nr:YdeI/OmpD-associated family protein [Propionibacteriales bacterium]
MAATTAEFTTELWGSGGNNVGIVVPPEVVDSFDRGKRVPVVVTIDGGYSYRTTTAFMGGQHLISFNAETRAATGRGAGDTVAVRLDLDDAPRTVDPPESLAAELTPELADAWAKLSPSNQKRLALSIDSAKAEDTRTRRVTKAIEELRTKIT